MSQIPRVFQLRHRVANRRRAEFAGKTAGQSLGTDRFPTIDVGLHQQLQNVLIPSRQLILLQHDDFL